MARPKTTVGDALKGAFRSIRNGTALNPVANAREMMNATAEREAYERAQGNEWYTKYLSSNDSVHLMLDRNGRMTKQRPHVHVIHDGAKGYVEIILTHADGSHEPPKFIDLDAGGTVIEQAIQRACARLPR